MSKRDASQRLSWLPAPPDDFRACCDGVDAMAGPRGAALRQLATHDLNENQLLRVSRSLVNATKSAANLADLLAPFRLGVISNATTDFIVPALVGTGVRHGFALDVLAAPFGVTLQAALAPDEQEVWSQCDGVLLALDYRAYFADYALRDLDPEAAVDAAMMHIRGLVDAFAAVCGRAVLIVQTIAVPPERLFGSFDRRLPGTPAWLAARFNDRLVGEVLRPGVSLLDVEGLVCQVGSATWYDPTQYMTARLPFASGCVPLYSDHLLRVVSAIRGRSRKVLVLDLDNTLWGGVIGDDGIDGIRLGQGDPRGEAYLDVQRAAMALKRRGVLLAVCSKNTEEIALAVIRKHPDMVLREDDFSAFQINWQDKATNLETLADRLSLGLDSFVFLDDSPVEREQVRRSLPQVFVPELPSDPAAYARLLMTAGLFESVAYSEEDRSRVAQYAANVKRDSLLVKSRDLGAFLQSLQMRAVLTSTGTSGWSRFVQLINKSNQFNLTARRVSEAEAQQLIADPASLTLQVRLFDHFGDNGMISSIIAVPSQGDWVLDTWVMSCRVLGREVERAVLNHIVAEARSRGVSKLIGIYRASDRNGMVKEHYAKLGFSPTNGAEGEDRWELDVAGYVPRDVPIDIVSNK